MTVLAGHRWAFLLFGYLVNLGASHITIRWTQNAEERQPAENGQNVHRQG